METRAILRYGLPFAEHASKRQFTLLRQGALVPSTSSPRLIAPFVRWNVSRMLTSFQVVAEPEPKRGLACAGIRCNGQARQAFKAITRKSSSCFSTNAFSALPGEKEHLHQTTPRPLGWHELCRSGADKAWMMMPLEAIQTSLIASNAVLGGPFWCTLVACTLAFRTALVPLTLVQMHASVEVTTGPLGQILPLLNKLYNKDMMQGANRFKATRMYLKALRMTFKLHKVNPLKLVAVPLTQISVLITYVVATRSLMTSGQLDLSEQGALWFQDLAAPDPTMILPMVAVFSSYTALEYSFGRILPQPGVPMKATLGEIVRETLQTFLVFGVPLIAQLPAGVFMYWIPSSLFGMTQTFALRNNRVRSFAGLPLLGEPRVSAPQDGDVVQPNPGAASSGDVNLQTGSDPPPQVFKDKNHKHIMNNSSTKRR